MFVFGFSEVHKGKKQVQGVLACSGAHLRGAETVLWHALAEKSTVYVLKKNPQKTPEWPTNHPDNEIRGKFKDM